MCRVSWRAALQISTYVAGLTHGPALIPPMRAQMVVEAAGLWEEELRYSEAMIERDVCNNSAWAQRAFIKLVRGRVSRVACCVGVAGGDGT
jgi:hypothetical protein